MINHILVPLDGSLLAECVLPHVIAFAQYSGAQITLIHVLDSKQACGSNKDVDPLDWIICKTEAEIYQRGVRDRLRLVGLNPSTVIIEGRAAAGIINYAHEHKVDLIAMSSHGQSGLGGWNLSSVVQKVLYHAGKSLLIIPAYLNSSMVLNGLQYQKVLVGLDGSRRAEWVLPEAMKLIAFHNACLLLAHIVPWLEMPPSFLLDEEEIAMVNRINQRSRYFAEIYIEELCHRLHAEPNQIKANFAVSENPIDALRELAEDQKADLIILSAHGSSGGYKRLYGSVTLSFITYGTLPMLVLQDLHPGIIQPTQLETALLETPIH